MHILHAPRRFLTCKPTYLKALHRGPHGGAKKKGKEMIEDSAPAAVAPQAATTQGGSRLLAMTALMATIRPDPNHPNMESLFTSILTEFDAEPDRAGDAEPDRA